MELVRPIYVNFRVLESRRFDPIFALNINKSFFNLFNTVR